MCTQISKLSERLLVRLVSFERFADGGPISKGWNIFGWKLESERNSGKEFENCFEIEPQNLVQNLHNHNCTTEGAIITLRHIRMGAICGA